MGFLDRAKKLAEQAKGLAEDALAESRAKAAASKGPAEPPATDARMGTPYQPGMLGRPGWRERGLTDPAAVLPVAAREDVGVPHTTRSQILEEPFGMGRRWSAAGRSVGLYYQLYPEHQAWEPPGGAAAPLPDGRSLVFLGGGDRRVVLELNGLDDAARARLAATVAAQLG